MPADTFAKLPVCALINDPKKLFQKKVYVTIPQWFETFPNVSDLRSGRNRAKCGLVLNDPIDWFKLRLNQPKMYDVCQLAIFLANTGVNRPFHGVLNEWTNFLWIINTEHQFKNRVSLCLQFCRYYLQYQGSWFTSERRALRHKIR